MIRNITKNTIVAKHERLCDSVLQKARGLMFTFKIKRPLVFIFDSEKRRGFHMFFVFYPIDMIFLDSSFKVVEIHAGFRPFAMYTTIQPFRYAIEIPQGTIAESGTRLGDILDIGAFKRRSL